MFPDENNSRASADTWARAECQRRHNGERKVKGALCQTLQREATADPHYQ